MNAKANILFVHDSKSASGKAFVQTLQKSIQGPAVSIEEAARTSLLFDFKKYNVIHFFLSASSKFTSVIRKAKGKTRTVQTLLSIPEKLEEYANLLNADHVIVFSEHEKAEAQKYANDIPVNCILPCLELPSITQRKPAAQVRSEFASEDQLLTVALGELTSQQTFTSLLYIIREYQRRGGFRVLLLLINQTKETKTWKERLLYSIDKEKLTATTVWNDSDDIFPLIDGADLFLYLARQQDPGFSFPLTVLQALSLGKPFLCYNVPPVSDAIRGFQPAWICQNTEDVVRGSLDIKKEAVHLEQISTEVARYARNLISPERVALDHLEIYERLLKS
jgi:glycosyltransferase involved in cell wall biosynthesis